MFDLRIAPYLPPASLLLLSATACERASADDFGVVVQVANDAIYHGTTETFGDPSIAGSVRWQPTDTFFAGASARFSPVDDQRQRHRSYDVFVGTAQSISQDWLMSVAVMRREFPEAPKRWQYTEFKAELSHARGFRARIDYAPNYYSHNTEAFIAEVDQTTFIDSRWFWQGQLGTVDLSADRFVDYSYARLGGGYTNGRLTLDLSYGWNSADGTLQFGNEPLRSPGLFLQLSGRLF